MGPFAKLATFGMPFLGYENRKVGYNSVMGNSAKQSTVDFSEVPALFPI